MKIRILMVVKENKNWHLSPVKFNMFCTHYIFSFSINRNIIHIFPHAYYIYIKVKKNLHLFIEFKKTYLGPSKCIVVTILFPYRKLKKNFFFHIVIDRGKNALFFYAI